MGKSENCLIDKILWARCTCLVGFPFLLKTLKEPDSDAIPSRHGIAYYQIISLVKEAVKQED